MYSKKLDVPLSLTFDDVLLEPLESWTEPDQTDTRTRLRKRSASISRSSRPRWTP